MIAQKGVALPVNVFLWWRGDCPLLDYALNYQWFLKGFFLTYIILNKLNVN